MNQEKKWVTGRHLNVGDKIYGYRCDGHLIFSWRRKIVGKNNFQIILGSDVNETDTETVDINAEFEIDMPDEEYYAKYKEKALELYNIIYSGMMSPDELGNHEMWNAWVAYDIFELAYELRKNNLILIGVSNKIIPRQGWLDERLLTLAVCAEDENGERFWCHAFEEDFFEGIQNSIEFYEWKTKQKFM